MQCMRAEIDVPDVMELPRIMKSTQGDYVVMECVNDPWHRFHTADLAQCYVDWLDMRPKARFRDYVVRAFLWVLPWR